MSLEIIAGYILLLIEFNYKRTELYDPEPVQFEECEQLWFVLCDRYIVVHVSKLHCP